MLFKLIELGVRNWVRDVIGENACNFQLHDWDDPYLVGKKTLDYRVQMEVEAETPLERSDEVIQECNNCSAYRLRRDINPSAVETKSKAQESIQESFLWKKQEGE